MHLAPGTPPRCYALVPCAGSGVRAGTAGPKQYARIGGRSVVAHTLAALAAVPRVAATLVVIAPDDDRFEAEAPGFVGERSWVAAVGGRTRAQTVAAGLHELQARGVAPHDWVLVHDAARCLLRPAWVERLIDACEDDEVGGLLALPVPDTMKDSRDGRAVATLQRDGKWLAQTPQMFRLALLQRALVQADADITDEASAIERLGHHPKLVRGDLRNLKVTWPEDFELAAALLPRPAA
ncbi:MAG: 2-C-methyl-D-erythritol 4-phosphate cytidylyltransferase [Rubrivivax sp.]|jgi:2-C-methyl-D-erythritol 4-phosphate cytidylyltransferase|nr:2-C-methyl-D-erythritol 4-phosphate cytidylyltransferase [Rubrivivax sp.]